MNVKEKPRPPPYNRRMFIWAREMAQVPMGMVKDRFPKVENWESGDAIPTVRQARKLAKYYDRSFTEFFRHSPPRVAGVELVPDFRLYGGAPDPLNNKYFIDSQLWVESARINALDLYESLNEEPISFPEEIFSSLDSDPEQAARLARDTIGFTKEEQLNLRQSDLTTLPSILRDKLEEIGILVLKKPDLKKFHARGMCIVEFPLPVIVYGNEAPTAQAFTLTHELGHILLKESGIIGPIENYEARTRESHIEKWCNRFASAFLIPIEELTEHFEKPSQPISEIDDDFLDQLAKIFRVSPHAMLIRLIESGYVDKRFYWDRKKAEFDEVESSYKSRGRPKYYGSRYKNALGNLYTGLVLEAWQRGVVTNHNAAEFMGIKNLTHLYDIKNEFLG